jgi:hypothetical protein
MLCIAVVFLTLGPALISSSRSGRSTVRIVVAPVPNTAQAPGSTISYVRAMLGPALRAYRFTVAAQGTKASDSSLYPTVRVEEAKVGGHAVAIAATTSSPALALDELRFVAHTIAVSSRQSAASWLQATRVELPLYERELARHDLSPAERTAVVAKRKFVRAAMRPGPPAGPLEAGHAVVQRAGFWDKLIARLPGDPTRPSRLWAGAAGFVLAVALCFGWVVVRRGWRAATP